MLRQASQKLKNGTVPPSVPVELNRDADEAEQLLPTAAKSASPVQAKFDISAVDGQTESKHAYEGGTHILTTETLKS